MRIQLYRPIKLWNIRKFLHHCPKGGTGKTVYILWPSKDISDTGSVPFRLTLKVQVYICTAFHLRSLQPEKLYCKSCRVGLIIITMPNASPGDYSLIINKPDTHIPRVSTTIFLDHSSFVNRVTRNIKLRRLRWFLCVWLGGGGGTFHYVLTFWRRKQMPSRRKK